MMILDSNLLFEPPCSYCTASTPYNE